MKKLLLITLLTAASYWVHGQSKGTNSVGLGLHSQNQKTQMSAGGNEEILEQRSSGFNLGYGHFIRDNQKIGFELFYGKTVSEQGGTKFSPSNGYGGSLLYQKYYPVYKKFYAFGSGRTGFNYSDGNYNSSNQGFKTNTYQLGASGGIAWFLSRRFALESDLLSANIMYNKFEDKSNGSFNGSTTTFTLNSSGAFNGLGFKIFLLF